MAGGSLVGDTGFTGSLSAVVLSARVAGAEVSGSGRAAKDERVAANLRLQVHDPEALLGFLRSEIETFPEIPPLGGGIMKTCCGPC